MRDIWNPWHGCKKISSGCKYCYMYYLDKVHNQDGSKIYRVKSNFYYPLAKDKNGYYKVKSGEKIRVCMTSDFFLEEADQWRNDAYDIMSQRKDVLFWLLTKRIERVKDHLPFYFNNIIMNVTCENQEMADKRIPELLELPFLYKGIMVAPMIGPINIESYLKTGEIQSVFVDGENYDGNRVLDYQWVKDLHQQCIKYDVHFEFGGTGNYFRINGKTYKVPRTEHGRLALKSGLYHEGKKVSYHLENFQSEQLSLFHQDKKDCRLCIHHNCSQCQKRG